MSDFAELSGKNFSFLKNKYNFSDDDLFLLNRVTDWAENSTQGYVTKFTGFLDGGRQALCSAALDSVCCKDYKLYGGYENAERKMLCVYSPFKEISLEDFPFVCLEFGFRRCDSLTHRDILGSLMSLGITRECVGDILVEEGRAQAFLTDTAAKSAENSIRKIGRIGVSILRNPENLIEKKTDFQEISGTVSSLRLDCVLSLAAKLSREKASAEIRSGKVMVNHFVQTNTSAVLKENDEFSARCKGKFLVKSVGNITKKGKIHINVLKYI